MTLSELAGALDLITLSGGEHLDRQVSGCYISDLLSDVMARSEPHQVWITLQVHVNVVAVAALKELAGVILVNDRRPLEETLEKARTEGLPLFTTPLSTYELAGRLYELGVGK